MASNLAPSTSGSSPRRHTIPRSSSRHVRRYRAAWRAWPSSTVGFVCSRARRVRSRGRDVRRSRRPLGVRLLVGDLHHRTQLLGTQRACVRGGRDRRQRLQRPRRLDLLPHRPRRLAIETDRRVDPAALVEHPHDRELLRLASAGPRLPPHGGAPPTTPWSGSATSSRRSMRSNTYHQIMGVRHFVRIRMAPGTAPRQE